MRREPGDGGGRVLVVVNFTPVPRHDYRVGVPRRRRAGSEVLNSDAEIYGGSGVGNLGGVDSVDVPWHGMEQSVTINVPPLAVVLLAPSAEPEPAPKAKP